MELFPSVFFFMRSGSYVVLESLQQSPKLVSITAFGFRPLALYPHYQLKRLISEINKSVRLLGNKRVLAVIYQKLNTLPLAKICQLFTPVRVFKYYCLNYNDHFYELFGCQEVSHHHNTRFNRNNNLNIPIICSSK